MKNRYVPTTGSIVRSKAGRDEGRYFIVTALDGEEYALIADGDLRKAEKPKRKKIKHLYVSQIESSLHNTLLGGQSVSNAEIRTCLKAFQQSEEG